jgi:translation initiation factor 3 subunit L
LSKSTTANSSSSCNAEGERNPYPANPSDDAVETFKELFLGACPKYLTVNPPPYEDHELLQQYIANPPQDPTNRHIELFLSDVKAVSGVVASRNLLKLYTSIDAAKLSAFLGESGEGDKEEKVLQQLMVLKAASRTYARPQGNKSNSLLDGERIVTNNLDFTIDGVSIVS